MFESKHCLEYAALIDDLVMEINWHIFFRVPFDCSSTSEASLKDMGAKPQQTKCKHYIYLRIWNVILLYYAYDNKIIIHYDDVRMGAIASQITSPRIVYSTVYSDADQRKHQSSASLAFVWGIHRDRWIPRIKGQLRGKCFHLMTSSCIVTVIVCYIVHIFLGHIL